MRTSKLYALARGASLAALLCIAGIGLTAQTVAHAEERDTGNEPAAIVWTIDMDCALCHTAEASSLEGQAHGDSALMTAAISSEPPAPTPDAAQEDSAPEKEATEQEDDKGIVVNEEADEAAGDTDDTATPTGASDIGDATCSLCHIDTDGLVETHTGAEDLTAMPKRLSQKIDNAVCLTCHGSYEDLAEATADSAVLTDTNDTTVNPHELPDSASHDTIACVDCHRVHADKDVEDTANQKCMSCHHENVYECYTCHE